MRARRPSRHCGSFERLLGVDLQAIAVRSSAVIRGRMRISRLSLAAALALCWVALLPAAVRAQWDVIAKAALPAVPYWWAASPRHDIEVVPLVWSNDVDGGSGGCCALGAAGRARLGEASVWLGLGFGTDPKSGTPAAIEAAAQIGWGVLAYRKLHGRSSVSFFVPILTDDEPSALRVSRLSAGISALSLEDDTYIEPVPLFSCPTSPAVPCTAVPSPYPWSRGQDFGLALEATWGAGEWRAPRLTGSLIWGIDVAGGDHGYLRGELDARIAGTVERFDWGARVAGGLAADGPPLQRRFLLYGADPVRRWLNPYVDDRGTLFQDVAYFMPGGPSLRAYSETQPLVERYLSAGGSLGVGDATPSGFWGRIDGFLEAAWTPGIPDLVGPADLNPESSFLFDWRELPQGEGSPGGQFNASVLRVRELWADAGFAFQGGFRNVAAMISLPLWASNAAFANAPTGDGPKKNFAMRWTLTVMFYPYGRAGG